MEMIKFNKNLLTVTPGSFSEAMKLKRAIGKAFNEKPIHINGLNTNVKDIFNQEITGELLNAILGPLLSLVTSIYVEDALFECCKRVVYSKEKVTRDFFETVEHRPLYYPIMIEVMKENIGPFFGDLFSSLNIDGLLKEIQE